MRNITYRAADGRFCIIDFEFATILDPAHAGVDADSASSASGGEDAQLRWSGITDRGRVRANNEDAFLALAFSREDFVYLGRAGRIARSMTSTLCLLSATAMGGERSGEYASRCAIDNITSLLPRRFSVSSAHCSSALYDCLHDLFQGIHWQLTTLGESYEDGRNMGATLSLVWYVAGTWYIGHIGDSRIYHLPQEGGIRQLSEDHTHVGWLRRAGQLNERQARTHPRRNVLSQSLGAGNQKIHPQLTQIKIAPGDRLLLCTDGVTEGLWDRGIDETLRDPPADQRDSPAADRLVHAAVSESGRDNATAVVIQCDAPANQPQMETA